MSRKPAAAPGGGKGGAAAAVKKGVPKKKDDDIISVEETVWTLRMGSRDPPCNVARFEEIWVGKGDRKRKVPRPPFDDPSVFTKPAYMYREQEAEEHSEDEDYEGPSKFDAFERPAFKRRTIKSRSIQWALEDSKDFSRGGGIKYVGDKITQQMSRYATFKVDPNRAQTIEVTPIEEWWQFKKAVREEGKMMSVKEAEELMKKQSKFLGPLSLANKVLGQKAMESGASSEYGTLDREDAQVLKEAGVKLLTGPEDGLVSKNVREDSENGSERGNVDLGVDSDADAGGEDDDFGDEVRSDDEEEVAKDDANEGGGTLHQDDEDMYDSEDDGHLTEDEHHELQKLSRSVNADGEDEEDDYTVNGDPGRASPTLSTIGIPTPDVAAAVTVGGAGGNAGAGDASSGGSTSGKRGASAMEEGGTDGGGGAAGGGAAAGQEAGVAGEANGGGGGGGGGGGSGGGSSSKRARKGQKKGSLEINQANVVATLRRFGGRLASKALLKHFVAALKVDGKKNKGGLALLREILKKVATKVDDAMEGTVYVLKKHFS